MKFRLSIFTILISFAIHGVVFSQLSLKQMPNIQLGETYEISKPKILKLFTQKPMIFKADFFDAYKICFKDVPFDYFGDCEYTFQFVKHQLVSVSVEYTFYKHDIPKFERFLSTILVDLEKDKNNILVGETGNLYTEDVFQYINDECITTVNKGDVNYKPINKKILGHNTYHIYKNSNYSGLFYVLWASLGEAHLGSGVIGIPGGYHGGYISVVLDMTNERLKDLKYQEDELSIHNYLPIEEETKIKLKRQNGVYQLPVTLNNVITIDFTLDLGAADVSISPDIYLVLYRSGTIDDSDFIGTQQYKFADGSTARSKVFNIKSLKIGDVEVKNVRASISNNIESPLLLGQSALKKLPSYKIDNLTNMLIIE